MFSDRWLYVSLKERAASSSLGRVVRRVDVVCASEGSVVERVRRCVDDLMIEV